MKNLCDITTWFTLNNVYSAFCEQCAIFYKRGYNMLNVSNLRKKYQKNVAVDDISFEVKKGCVSLLLGHNGAGKTTTINCVLGITDYSGNILINGVSNKKIEVRKIIGYIPEVPELYDFLTVWEHLEFIARAYGVRDWKSIAEDFLKRFELSEQKDKLCSDLSKGMKQKLNICGALITNPQLLIFDEPFVGLDPQAIRTLKDMFLELKNRGCSILISTHMLDMVDEVWDDAFILAHGKIVSVLKHDSTVTKQVLEKVYIEVSK